MTIPAVDLLLQAVLVRDVPLADEKQVGFQPPDADWGQRVDALRDADNMPVFSLNVFLVDLVENTPLRSNKRGREVVNGIVHETPAPFRVDCHYLVSAWYPAKDSEAILATREEHAVLWRALRALVRSAPLIPARTLSDKDLKEIPAALQDAELPTRIVPAEGFAKIAEFWSGMGDDIRWHPVVHVVVTIPVLYAEEEAGGVVETIITDTGLRGRGATLDAAETLVIVGGSVVDKSSAPVPFARVQLQTPTGQRLDRVTAGPDGRFRFAGLTPGTYTLSWWANGLAPPPAPQPIDVPSTGGQYELKFT